MAVVSKPPGRRKRTRVKPRPKVLVLHGPLMGASSFSDIAGPDIIATIDSRLADEASRAAVDVITYRGEREDALIARVQSAAGEGVRFMVIDPAGLVHLSAPLRAALSAAAIPFIEVQLSNVHQREQFDSSAADGATAGAIVGLGAKGYELALTYALRHVKE